MSDVAIKFFRYQADTKPIMIFLSLFFLDLVVFYFNPSPILAFTYAVLFFFPKSMITAWNHHHQHVPTFKQPVLNMLLEIVYSFQTGVLPEGWVLHHNLGHHKNYLDGVKDESAWVTKSGHRLTEFQYTMKVTSLSYSYIIRNAFNNNARHGLRFLIGAFLVSVVFWGMCLYNPTNAVILFLLPAVAGLFGTVWYTYKHHAGLYTETKEHASWNVLDPLYNKLTGNLGYHTAHHISCGVHWSKLPELHNKIRHKIPEHLYRGPGFPFNFFKRLIWIWDTIILKRMRLTKRV